MTSLSPHSRGRGFTLLEMLVVLVLTGFIMTILLEGLSQTFRLQEHFGTEQFNTQRGAMRSDWFRQSINGLLPDHEDGRHKFQGDDRRMSGLTTAPLTPESAGLAPFTWRLGFDPQSGETRLQYGAESDSPAILAWRGDSGRFVYLDSNGEAHGAWPPLLGKWPQLPKAIYLEARRFDEPYTLVAIPRGLDKPLPRQKDVF